MENIKMDVILLLYRATILALLCANIDIMVRLHKKIDQKINNIDKKISSMSLEYEDLSDEKRENIDAILTAEARKETQKNTQYTK